MNANPALIAKIKATFIAELGFEPTNIQVSGEYATSNGFYCCILNGKTIKKTHKLAWRKDN